MSRVFSLSFGLAGFLGCVFLSSCGESEGGRVTEKGTGKDTTQPPMQQAIYLRAKGPRVPGTSFRNSATLSMTEATLVTRRGDDSITGSATTILRDVWEVMQDSPTERTITIKEMSRNFELDLDGKPRKERTDSTLANFPLTVTRTGDDAPWKLTPPEQKLTNIQEIDLRMLGKLWEEGSEEIYPVEPLELGQSWKADPKAFGMIVSPRLVVEQGEVTCRLDEITVLRGERCGAVNVDIDISGKFEMAGSAGIQVQIALTGTIMRSLYKNYDMRTELKGTMQMEMEFPEQDSTISIDGVAEFLQMANMKVPETS